MTRALVTGGSGFIGRPTVDALVARGFEVHLLARRAARDGAVVSHACDLLDRTGVDDTLRAVSPAVLVHLAWNVEPGAYWRSPKNLDWVGASLDLVRAFAERGGRRVVVAGSCAEYAWESDRFVENETPRRPATLYGAAKDGLHRILAAYADVVGLSLAWGRVFFLYGPGEKPGRLVPDAIRSLLAGQAFETSHGRQERDFLHVDDVGGAFAALAACDVRGAVNLGSGRAVPVRTIVERLADAIGRPDLLRLGARELAASEPPRIEADIRRLAAEVGFQPSYSLDQGLAQSLAWWRNCL